ncbi:hypothetical protein VP01_245g3 [Puccinia sorghi]|uniref:Uncharacterized protein n=1 Tax=Puccinia sorghi TaxID=27349 RepID=A0A0L6V696_9BASI|nr:hypothetical protein VP01_245g3 [Puccinia sorghi]
MSKDHEKFCEASRALLSTSGANLKILFLSFKSILWVMFFCQHPGRISKFSFFLLNQYYGLCFSYTYFLIVWSRTYYLRRDARRVNFTINRLFFPSFSFPKGFILKDLIPYIINPSLHKIFPRSISPSCPTRRIQPFARQIKFLILLPPLTHPRIAFLSGILLDDQHPLPLLLFLHLPVPARLLSRFDGSLPTYRHRQPFLHQTQSRQTWGISLQQIKNSPIFPDWSRLSFKMFGSPAIQCPWHPFCGLSAIFSDLAPRCFSRRHVGSSGWPSTLASGRRKTARLKLPRKIGSRPSSWIMRGNRALFVNTRTWTAFLSPSRPCYRWRRLSRR